jgi:hypothetical protein
VFQSGSGSCRVAYIKVCSQFRAEHGQVSGRAREVTFWQEHSHCWVRYRSGEGHEHDYCLTNCSQLRGSHFVDEN